MSWEYRVCREWQSSTLAPGLSGYWYSIRELYYSPADKGVEDPIPHSWSMAEIGLHGETMEELEADLERMKSAIGRRVWDLDTKAWVTV